jgi:hypothetical protein
MAFVGTFSLRDLVGHHWDSNMGVGFIPQSAWARLEKDKNLVETIRASKVAYAKPLKLAWGAQNWTLESNKRNRVKKMDAISKYLDFEIIHGRYISIFKIKIKIVCILTLESNLFFYFLVLGFEAQQRRLLLKMQFDLHLSIVNYLFITMQLKL